MKTDTENAKILWDYNGLNQNFTVQDFIFVMCSYNLLVADCAADLWHDNKKSLIVVSGGIAHTDDLLATGWGVPEAHVFLKRLIDLGVPESQIIVEDEAQNCGENITLTKKKLDQKNKSFKSGVIVQKPYMERRAYATACRQWPEIEWSVTSPRITYEDYLSYTSEDKLIHILVGDTYRMDIYAEKGFQTPQEMPDAVKKALQELIDKGYTKHIH